MGPCFGLGLFCMPVSATPTSPPLPLRLTELLPGVSMGCGGWHSLSWPGNPTGQILSTCLPIQWENSFCILGPLAQIQKPLKCPATQVATWERTNLAEYGEQHQLSEGTCCHGNTSVSSKSVRVRDSGQIRLMSEGSWAGWRTEENGQEMLAEKGRKESLGLTSG